MKLLFSKTKNGDIYSQMFPYQVVLKNKKKYFSIMIITNIIEKDSNTYEPQNYIMLVEDDNIKKIDTLYPVRTFTVLDCGSIIYATTIKDHNYSVIRNVSILGEDISFFNKPNIFSLIVDIQGVENSLIILDKKKSLLSILYPNNNIININDGKDIINPNCFVKADDGYLIGAKKYIWFVNKNGIKVKIRKIPIYCDNGNGFDKLCLRDNKLVYTVENNHTEIYQYDNKKKEFLYLMTDITFKKHKKGEFLEGFFFDEKGKLIFWTEKDFSKPLFV